MNALGAETLPQFHRHPDVRYPAARSDRASSERAPVQVLSCVTNDTYWKAGSFHEEQGVLELSPHATIFVSYVAQSAGSRPLRVRRRWWQQQQRWQQQWQQQWRHDQCKPYRHGQRHLRNARSCCRRNGRYRQHESDHRRPTPRATTVSSTVPITATAFTVSRPQTNTGNYYSYANYQTKLYDIIQCNFPSLTLHTGINTVPEVDLLLAGTNPPPPPPTGGRP